MTDTSKEFLVHRCNLKGCEGIIVPDITGRPMCYLCGPRHMLPTYHYPSLKSEAAMGMGMAGLEAGTKYDRNKADWSLLPWEPLEEVVRVMEHGASKYSRNNWMYVDDATWRYTKALLRHVVAFAKGENYDKDSKLHHLAHAVCCCLFILHFRPKDASDAKSPREL